MFTEKPQRLIELAKSRAHALGLEALNMESLLAALGSENESVIRLAECLGEKEPESLRSQCPELGSPDKCGYAMSPDNPLRRLLGDATELSGADGLPDPTHPGLIGLEHLVCATAMSPDAVSILGNHRTPISKEAALQYLSRWLISNEDTHSLGELTGRLRTLRRELLSKVFGQDHAVHAAIEGLYNAEVTAAADIERKRPRALFVFAGPPGVGKTYLSELCASHLARPFRRFDMTSYSDQQSEKQLIGFEPSYRGAQPGLLTGFVQQHPDAILLFDEIEKAHLATIQLFYQILDAGRLSDKFTDEEVSFKDTIIIFTTNAGRSLYENPNSNGIAAANANYHKRTILSALANEKNPANGRPAFPAAICSRLGQGYPVMFNHLEVHELVRIVNAEMQRTEALLEKQYFKNFRHDDTLPLALVLREGAAVDARQLRSEAERFIKTELFKFCSLYGSSRVEDVLEDIDSVELCAAYDELNRPEIQSLFERKEKPTILLVADDYFLARCQREIQDIRWLTANMANEAIEQLAVEGVDLVLLDLWFRSPSEERHDDVSNPINTVAANLDHIPLSARALNAGREMLRMLRERCPETPVYLLSLPEGLTERQTASRDDSSRHFTQSMALDAGHGPVDVPNGSLSPRRKPIDDELFLACVRAGGARGLVSTSFGTAADQVDAEKRAFVDTLMEISERIYRQQMAKKMGRERKALEFDTASKVDVQDRALVISLRDLRLRSVVDADDAAELLSNMQRPNTKFEDVLGATEAKKSLKFVVDWLREPKRYSALGLRPPKGVLMAGPPGTGKTMLARAVAGESDCVFCQASATSFVTMWQGSGPQNIRDLFQRARRYAPAIVFIDEIDAIGKERTGGPSSRAQEETLNALLTEMDGFGADTTSPIIVLAATNLVEKLDEALKRRFDRTIEVDKPDRAARFEYLRRCFENRKNCSVSIDTLERLAQQSAGMTIANLERIVQETGVSAAQAGRQVDDALLEESFELLRMGEAKKLPDSDTLLRIARHEAGHVLIAWQSGNRPFQVTIVGRGGAGGYMERKPEEERILYTKAELELRIREAMAGRAAEIACYGPEAGLSSGVSGDLQHATQLALRMVKEFAMNEDIGHIALNQLASQGQDLGNMSEKIALATERIVKKELDRAVSIVDEQRPKFDALVAALVEKNRLNESELAAILE